MKISTQQSMHWTLRMGKPFGIITKTPPIKVAFYYWMLISISNRI